MGSVDATKTCCGGHYPVSELFCIECRRSLEESHYRLWILLTTVVAASVEWILAHSGVLKKFLWPEVLMLEVLLLMFAYPLAKLVQRLRTPERPVLKEMGSVFADRWSRVMFIGLWAFIGLTWSGRLPKVTTAQNLVDPADAGLRSALVTTSLIGLAVVSALMLIDQGPRFFDLRLSTTYRR